jgi:hypothetical protein
LGEFSLIGRLLALGSFFTENDNRSQLLGKSYALILTKNGPGYILGDFFHKLIWSPLARNLHT